MGGYHVKLWISRSLGMDPFTPLDGTLEDETQTPFASFLGPDGKFSEPRFFNNFQGELKSRDP